ncbi:MAG: hypothetical protein ACKVJA_04410, partial [Flavobacteriales bacterium]
PFYGCTDSTASNYDSTATFDDGSCIYPTVTLTGQISNISCYGQIDGSVDLIVTGGLAPFIYIWNNGSTTEDIFSLT